MRGATCLLSTRAMTHETLRPAYLARGLRTGRTGVGLHRVEVAAVNGVRVLVRNLDAVNETPIVDVKPVIAGGR
jgi:tRNA-methyltransferase O